MAGFEPGIAGIGIVFDHWADTSLHLLLLKGSMLMWIQNRYSKYLRSGLISYTMELLSGKR